MSKITRDTYDEQIAQVQKQIAEKKRKKRKLEEDQERAVGKAILNCFPALRDMMYEDNFDINEFVKSEDFQKAFYYKFVNKGHTCMPAWTNEGVPITSPPKPQPEPEEYEPYPVNRSDL